MSLSERLNLTTNSKEAPSYAVELATQKDTAYYDTLCLYCANNNIDLKNINDDDFMNCADVIEQYAKSSVQEYSKIYFWLDQE